MPKLPPQKRKKQNNLGITTYFSSICLILELKLGKTLLATFSIKTNSSVHISLEIHADTQSIPSHLKQCHSLRTAFSASSSIHHDGR